MRLTIAALGCIVAWSAAAGPGPSTDCRAGAWLDPATGAVAGHGAVLARAAARGVVLLGETHDDPDHHRWQLSVIAGLLALQPRLAIGFEALPRRVQPALDRWIAGELDDASFLEAVAWRRVWKLPAELYLPLFHLARLHRLPVSGLNVERGLVARVGREGWAAIPPAERQGVGDPAAPAAAYRARLARYHRAHQHGEREAAADGDGLRRFVEAQLVWDRAMAEGLARARRGGALVVGVIGSEHLRHGEGVPHQLADLGVEKAAVLLPHEAGRGCPDLEAGEADAVFLLQAPARAAAPTSPPGQ